MDSKQKQVIDEALRKSRSDYDVAKRKIVPAEFEAKRAAERVVKAERELEKLKADAQKEEAEHTKIKEDMEKYHTGVEDLEHRIKAEAEKLKRAT